MIRDPSDGTVRENTIPADAPPTDPWLEEILAALTAGKVAPERVSREWEYQRAWNDGIDFSITQIKRLFDSRSA